MFLPRIFRFRYTLRALLVFITLFAIWGGYHANRAFRERRAERVLGRAGIDLVAEPGRAIWPYRFIVAARRVPSLNEELAHALIDLPFLRELSVQAPRDAKADATDYFQAISPRAPLSSRAIESVLAKSQIETLSLDGWKLADSTCEAVGRNATLNCVSLTSCGLSEDELVRVASAPRLTDLHLKYCAISDSGRSQMRGSATLKALDLTGTPVRAAIADMIARCPNLKLLTAGAFVERLDLPCVDDEFVSHLGAHPSIEFLELSESRVTSKSIPTILAMQSLRTVILPEHVEAENSELLLRRFGP
jgi:hypothetical protein